jgi:hypothetical protein
MDQATLVVDLGFVEALLKFFARGLESDEATACFSGGMGGNEPISIMRHCSTH